MPFDFSPTVLLVADDLGIRRLVRGALEAEGCAVHEADTLKRGIVDAGTRQPDLVILDLGLPDGDGSALIREMRTWTEVPILALSSRSDEVDMISSALDAGADDYLTTPFGARELVARLRVLLRRHARFNLRGSAQVTFGDINVDFACRLVTRAGAVVHLTPIEFQLLAVLIAHRGKVMTYRELLREVWGPAHTESSQYVRVYMGHLRHKLEADPAQPVHLLTEVGLGYRFAG